MACRVAPGGKIGDIMAWNPSPQVAAARDYAKKFGWQNVVILSFDFDRGKFEVTTYGETKAECDRMDRVGKQIMDKIKNEEISVE